MNTKRITIEKARGYTGKKSGKSYVARIDGIDPRFGFSRDFLERDDVDWGDSQLFKRAKGCWTEMYDLTEGLYEVSEFGERTLRMVGTWVKKDATEPSLNIMTVSEERARLFLEFLDRDFTFDQARRLSSLPAERLAQIEVLLEQDIEIEAAITQTKPSPIA